MNAFMDALIDCCTGLVDRGVTDKADWEENEAVLSVHLVPLFKLCGGANLAFATVATNRNMKKMIKWVSIAQDATNDTVNGG